MGTSLVDADSLLAIDIGTVSTRAILFDVVEGRYRFLASGTAPTTAGAPYQDVTEGVRSALEQLQVISGRTLIGADGQLLIPSQQDGAGVDACVATLSAGPPLKVVAVGLLENISAESAENLATTTYARVVETMSLNDRRKTSTRLDTIMRVRPDLIVVAGGAEQGATQSVLSLLEAVGLACYLLPRAQRPEVLFAGNAALVEEVKEILGTQASLHISANVRPTLDIEQLTPAQPVLGQIFRQIRARQMNGVAEVDLWAKGKLMPTSMAFGRLIRFISKEYSRTGKGVLGVDIGASSTTIASAFAGDLFLNVQTRLGLGDRLPQMLELCTLADIQNWLSVEVSDADLLDYVYNKSLYPFSMPATAQELAIEHALVCQAIYLCVRQARRSYPSHVAGSAASLLPWFEPIVATGSALTQAPRRSQTLIMLLNALQPTGITTIALDRNNLAPALGAAADVNPLLLIQALDSTNFMNLCTVISPVGRANFGMPILRAQMQYADGHESRVDVKMGALEVIPLPPGQFGSLKLNPLNRFDVGMGGAGRGGSVRVMGGQFGVVIDARGRPLCLPEDPARRRELHKKWLWTVES
ncbi:MAG: glutamate mutase L [Anaerolineales bacterium]|nr:glutamate mutase L [Anaerolineales bacterium]